MIAQSKSPKVDQYYATLRSNQSKPYQSLFFNKSTEDLQITRIRQISKDLFGERSLKKGQLSQQFTGQLEKDLNNSSSDQMEITRIRQMNKNFNQPKPNNKQRQKRYSEMEKLKKSTKYKKHNVDGQISKIVTQTVKSKEKYPKSKKYSHVTSKFQEPRNLNYVKKTDLNVKKEKQIKKDQQRVKREMKKTQVYYERKIRENDREKNKLGNILQRGKDMLIRKSMSIETIKQQRRYNEMKEVTFNPIKLTKDRSNKNKDFSTKMNEYVIKSLSKEKKILKETIGENYFKPYINQNHQSPSKIKQIWHQESLGEKTFTKEEEQPTMNSTTHITLKNSDELIFMLF